jgi:RpiR family carbohydrate utilization transcriptional regulator
MATFHNRLKAIEKEMTNTEKKIANILLNTDKSFMLSMNELSKLSNVSEPSVVRFYRRIGYSSFQELKVALVQENIGEDNAATGIFEEIVLGDSADGIFNKVLEHTILALQTTKHMINYNAMEQAVHALVNARRLYFFGQGISGIIANDAAHKFTRLGMTAIPITDVPTQAVASSHMDEADVLLAISHTGESRDQLQVLKLAREKNAHIIVITGFSKSSIAQVADDLLVTSAKETEYRSDAMVSRIVQLAIIDTLYVMAVLRKGKEGIDAVNTSRLATAKLKT